MNALTSKMGRVVVLATAMVAMAGCASTPNTYANTNPTAHFGEFRTFGFVDDIGTDYNAYESLETGYLKAAIAGELESRGLAASESPDLLINFHVHTKEKLRTHRVPTTAGFGYYDPFYDAWGLGAGYRTEVRQYTEGTLTIDVVDARQKKLVWEGAAVGRITDRTVRNLEETVYSAVGEIMKDYPVVSAAS